MEHADDPISRTLPQLLRYGLALTLLIAPARAQLTDVTQTPNAANSGIQRSMVEQIGTGRGDVMTPDSSRFVIERDPFRSIARGRQLFQRKFTAAQGLGPRAMDGTGNIELHAGIGAGLSDSCASCHGRPHGAAGVGGTVYTRPEGRDAPHLFGLGLVEMIADEITSELRATRSLAVQQAAQQNQTVTLDLVGKGVHYGRITAFANGSVDTTQVLGVNADLRVRPFFADGRTISIREFVVGALGAEMGLQAPDHDLWNASQGADVLTPSGMALTGSLDAIEAPPVNSPTADADADGVTNEIPESLVDHLEFYLLNYFKPGTGRRDQHALDGRRILNRIGCTQCHVPNLTIDRDRRVADVATVYDALNSNRVLNSLYATAMPRFVTTDDGSGFPAFRRASLASFEVREIYADFKMHDLGPAFHERNFDGSVTTQFLTEPLWGVGSTAPYGHDGRSATLEDVILRHGGEAQAARDAFVLLSDDERGKVQDFLQTLVLFGPPDTASNLAPVNPAHPNYPLQGLGSIDLSVLFNVPALKE